MQIDLPVIFRRDGDEITAVFPTVPGTNDPSTMTCYAHIGQHGSCHADWVRSTSPSLPGDYAPLLAELRSIYETDEDGIKLQVRHRISPAMNQTRFDGLRRVAA